MSSIQRGADAHDPVTDFNASTGKTADFSRTHGVMHAHVGHRRLFSHPLSYHGSNSWMMLSNRITAKSLELNPARQARKRMLKESKDCHPAGCVSPPDRPPLPPPPPAAPGRLFPCTDPPELLKALCLPSLAAWCSAISARRCRLLWFARPFCRAPVSPSKLH